MTPTLPGRFYHLVSAAYWHASDPNSDYYPAYFADEGFIHATIEPEQVERIANRIFGDSTDAVLLLEIETAKVLAEIRLEESKGHWYPHIYGGLNRAAVRRVGTMTRDTDGRLRFPTDWQT